MFVNTGVSPVINFGDYELSVVPQHGYLKVNGEYHISSNWNVPDNLIELKHKLPSQLVDKVFLKKTGRSCNSPYLNLKCFIYKSSSFIDVKNDLVLNSAVNNSDEFLMETSFSINKQVNHNLINHDYRWSREMQDLQSQISRNVLKNNLSLKKHHFLNSEDLSQSSGHFTLDLVKSATLTSEGRKEYKYQKVGFYLPKMEELAAGASILSVWEIPEKSTEKSSLTIKTLSGKLALRELNSNKYKNIDLRTFHWNKSKHRESIIELMTSDGPTSLFDKNNFREGEIDVVLSISNEDWTNIVHLKSPLKQEDGEELKLENSIYINPYDPLLRNLKLDHTWIVEKI